MIQKQTVLLIDDAEPMGKFLGLFLSSKYEVTLCQDSGEAIQLLENGFRPSAIVTDLEMPALSGTKLITQLRSLRPNTPICVVSGLQESRHRIESLNAGADDFLTKPLHPAELSLRIGKAITRSNTVLPVEKNQPAPRFSWASFSYLSRVAAAF